MPLQFISDFCFYSFKNIIVGIHFQVQIMQAAVLGILFD